MSKKMICALAAGFMMLGQLASAATISVPTQQPSVQAAIDAAADNDTIQITDSAVYSGVLTINKPVSIVAATGQTPVIQNGNTSGTVVMFGANAGGSQLGSLTGGRITVRCNNWSATTASNPDAMFRFRQTTGTTVVVENVDAISTGVTTVPSPWGIYHDQAIANTVTLRYFDMNLNHPATVSTSRYAVMIGPFAAPPATVNSAGPVYNMDHVRIRGYRAAAVWPNYVNATVNMNYFENGVTAGERLGTQTYPYGGIVNSQAGGRWTGRIQNSIFRGGYAQSPVWIGSTGSSVTLSRCVMVNSIGLTAAKPYGAIMLGPDSGTVPVPNAGRMNITVDHCDLIDLSPTSTFVGAISTRRLPETAPALTTYTLTVTNSNIYSMNNKATNVTMKAGDVFTSDYNNVYSGTAAANIGYTAGAHDLSFDPNYQSALAGDARYSNNTLKSAASDAGAIGTNGNYSDLYKSGIVPGTAGGVSRARHWTSLN